MATATLELFHHWADEAGWVLEIDGGRIALEGRVRSPALPGPSALVVDYVDAPAHAHAGDALRCRSLGDGTAHITGMLVLRERSALPIDVVAAVVT